MAQTVHFDAVDEAATAALGRRLATVLFPGAVIGLVGQLGAGKTRLVQAIAEGLDIADPRAVSSPTFVLIQEYNARLPIYHFDAYRLHSEAEFFDLGAHEYFQDRGVCLVEWADRVMGCMPAELLVVHIQVTGPSSRRFVMEAFGERYHELVRKVQGSPKR